MQRVRKEEAETARVKDGILKANEGQKVLEVYEFSFFFFFHDNFSKGIFNFRGIILY